MSLSISDAFLTTEARQEIVHAESSEELLALNNYLAVLEENKRAARFVPDDAMMALDMAGFVRNRLCGDRPATGSSLSRLALALVQESPAAPVQ